MTNEKNIYICNMESKSTSVKSTTQNNRTTQVVREAMRIVSKDVRRPKVVRDGLISVKVPVSKVKS